MEKICERHNIPHKITLFGHEIDVSLVDDLQADDGEGIRYGEAEFGEPPEIRINSICGPLRAYQTLVHEIIEHINSELELELPHPQITRLELGLTNFLLNNDIDWGYVNGSAN